MARPRQFEMEYVLDKAKDLFWRNGYEATSMEELLQTMGLNRASFYNAFGGKRELMLLALRRYDSNNRAATLRSAASGRPPLEAIRHVFRAMVDGSRGPMGKHGCFLVNSALEVAPKDPEAARIVRGGLRDVEQFFTQLARRAVVDGDLPAGCDPAETGRALMNHLVGLMVLVRAGANKATLSSVVRQVELLLG